MASDRNSAARWAGILGGSAGLLLGALYAAPAMWLSAAVERATGAHVLLQNPQGSVWSGSALLTLAAGQGAAGQLSLPSRVHWTLRPAWSGVQIRLQAPCCFAQGIDIALSPRQVQLRQGNAHVPMEVLRGLGTPWNTLALGGAMRLDWSDAQLTWSAGHAQVQGTLVAQAMQVSTRLTTLPQVGSYELSLQGGDTPQLGLRTTAGPLLLQGQGQWHAGKFSFQGQAQAEPASAASLANLLTLMGTRRGNTTTIKFG